jgi:hypothetical protein
MNAGSEGLELDSLCANDKLVPPRSRRQGIRSTGWMTGVWPKRGRAKYPTPGASPACSSNKAHATTAGMAAPIGLDTGFSVSATGTTLLEFEYAFSTVRQGHPHHVAVSPYSHSLIIACRHVSSRSLHLEPGAFANANSHDQRMQRITSLISGSPMSSLNCEI